MLVGKPDIIGQIEVRLKDPEDAIAVNDQVEKMFGYDAESWKETNANFLSLFVMQNTIIGFVIGAILLVGGFGILSIQIMIVLQKQRDIAILRSIGLRRNDILAIFLVQGVLISLVGGLLGDGAGHLALMFIATLKVHMEGLVKADSFIVADDPALYWYGLGFAVGVGTIASLVPAWRGSKVEPVDVLRGQIG
jgi:lipoprotein-releasing system permease protein